MAQAGRTVERTGPPTPIGSVAALPAHRRHVRVPVQAHGHLGVQRRVHLHAERARLVYAVTLRLDNRSEELKAGMPADAYLSRDPAK